MTVVAIDFLLCRWKQVALRNLLVFGTSLLLAFVVAFAHARPLTSEEEATLVKYSDPLQVVTVSTIAAVRLAEQLGQENNLDALPVLLRLKNDILLSYFANNYHAPASPELELLVLPYLKQPTHWAANTLARLLLNYHSREVFDALYQSARQRLILEQSTQSRIAGLKYPGLQELTRTDLKNIEEPVAQLLPLAGDAAQVFTIVLFLGERGYVPATGRLVALLKRSESNNYVGAYEVNSVLIKLNTAEGTAAVRERLQWLTTQPPGYGRDKEIAGIVRSLAMAAGGGDQPRFAQEEMDHIEAELAKLTLTPETRRDLKDSFERHYYISRAAATQAANRAPILGPWTQETCERSARETLVLSDGPTTYMGISREEARQLKEKGEKRMIPNQAFCYGLVNGHKEVFEACAALPIDFNKPCDGRSPLSYAVAALDDKLIERLVERGADPKGLRFPGFPKIGNLVDALVMQCADEKGVPPACERVLRKLIALGADINDLSGGRAPIDYVAYRKNEALMALLLTLGADINRKDEYGGSALDHAALSGDLKVAEFLREHGGHSNPGFQIRAAAMGAAMMLTCMLGGCH